MNIPINIETLLAGKVVESERIEYKKGWNPAEIMRTVAAFANDFENLGSGYIVVGVEEINGMAKRPVFGFDGAKFDKVQKEIRVRRYRNRRIGEFLKELGLTEGKGTGIPTIKRALEVNGSPPAKYDTDGDERRYFVTEIPVHPEFLKEDSNQDSNQDEEKSNYVIAKLSSLLNQEINYDIAKNIKSTEKILTKIVMVLEFCFAPRTRDEIFDEIEMSNQTRNYNDIVKPAIDAGLVSMTIPKKPKSKYQKYITTEKGKKLIESKND